MTIVSVILLILAFLIWAVLLSMIGTMNSSDPAGNGMTYGFAFVLVIALWILLAVLMIVAARSGEIPGWAKLAALVVLPLSFGAAAATISLLANSSVKVSGWPIVVPQ